MSDPRVQYEIAVELANDALAEYRAEPSPAKFRVWRDANEVAVKWCRAARLNSNESDTDDQLEELLAG